MPSRENFNQAETLPILILNAYNQYIHFGYPKDPSIYVLRASKKTLERMKVYFDENVNYIPKMELALDSEKILFEGYYFQLQINNDLRLGEFWFGPELLELKWKGN